MTPIRPAFTPEQWSRHLSGDAPIKRGGETEIALGCYATLHENPTEVPDHGVVYDPPHIEEPRPFLRLTWCTTNDMATVHYRRHGLAALTLHRMPYGFTHDDVQALELLREKVGSVADCGPQGEGWQSDALEAAWALIDSLADRIAALLPPRSP